MKLAQSEDELLSAETVALAELTYANFRDLQTAELVSIVIVHRPQF